MKIDPDKRFVEDESGRAFRVVEQRSDNRYQIQYEDTGEFATIEIEYDN